MPLLLLFRPKRHIMCRFGRLLRCFLVSYRGKLTLPLHVGASFISLALIFYTKNQSSLMPLLHVAASLLIRRIFYQKYGFALSACRSFFPKSCAFGEFQCRFAAFAPSFAKRHARLVCSLASALTDGSLSLPPFCEYGCGANFSIARRFSFLYAKNPRLTQAVKPADFSI